MASKKVKLPTYAQAVITKCGLCINGADARYFCDNCQQEMCEQCKQIHLMTKLLSNHTVISIAMEVEDEKPIFCTVHPQELIQLFCNECNIPVCHTCIITAEHQPHVLVKKEHVVDQCRKELSKCISETQEEILELEAKVETVSNNQKEYESQHNGTIDDINKRRKKLKSQIDKAADDRIQETKRCKRRHIKELKKQDDDFTRIISDKRAQIESCEEIQTKRGFPVVQLTAEFKQQFNVCPSKNLPLHVITAPKFVCGKAIDIQEVFDGLESDSEGTEMDGRLLEQIRRDETKPLSGTPKEAINESSVEPTTEEPTANGLNANQSIDIGQKAASSKLSVTHPLGHAKRPPSDISSLPSDDESDNNMESIQTVVPVLDVDFNRFKRKKTDLKVDNRIKYFYEDDEIQLISLESQEPISGHRDMRSELDHRTASSGSENIGKKTNPDLRKGQPASALGERESKHEHSFTKSESDPEEKIPGLEDKDTVHGFRITEPDFTESKETVDQSKTTSQQMSSVSSHFDQSESRLQQIPFQSTSVPRVAQVQPVIPVKHEEEIDETVPKVASVAPQPVKETTESQSMPAMRMNQEKHRMESNLPPNLGRDETKPLYGTPKEAFNESSVEPTTEDTPSSLDETLPMLEELTLKEAARAGDCTDPKSQGADTIICIDVSDSMAGEPIQQAKFFINDFLDGIEEAAVEYGLEENIAIVVYGHETKVLQHLTNDYGKIRGVLDTLETGGPSPMMTGLVLCLSAIYNRGGVVTYRNRKIQPRILLISDGKATDQRILTGEDIIKPPSSLTMVHDKLKEFAERLRNEPRIIHCIPVGESDTTIMNQISEITGGSVMSPSRALLISRHFLLNTVAAKITTSGAFDNDDNPERGTLETMAKEQLKEAGDQSHINEVLKMVDEEITQTRADSMQSGSRNLSEAELLKNIPPVGTRVRRAKDWKYELVDDDGPGTVTGNKSKGWVLVEWDGGNKGKYRFGAEAAMDIRPVDEQRYLNDGELTAVGVRVRRGPDWEWGNQDGGEKATGVIFEIEDGGIVHVRWDNGKKGNYRFGLFNKFDVEICAEAVRHSVSSNLEEDLVGATAAPPPVQKTRPQWQWKDSETNQWRNHSLTDSERIETLFKKGKGSILVICNNELLRVVPQSMQQYNVAKGINIEIRRTEVPIG